MALFGTGLIHTLAICVYAATGSIVLGSALAAARVSPVPILQRLGAGWVGVFLNCPLPVVLFFMAFGLPEIGINGSYFWFGVAGLTMYTSAFMCEAVRAGVNSVPVGQAEAARSIGLPFGSTLTNVVLPQAFRSSVPPLANALIAMIKNSAIVGAFGVGSDLYSVIDTLTASQGAAALPVLAGVMVGYLLIIFPLGLSLGVVERRVAISR